MAKIKPFLRHDQQVLRHMEPSTKELIEIFSRTTDPKQMATLFQEIFTPSEINTLTLRWKLLKDLFAGKTQRKIAAEHNISLCKITRGSKILKTPGSYLRKILEAGDMGQTPSGGPMDDVDGGRSHDR
jgi:TrpR family trp operon transcriptional repressor